jgi:muconolactone delta-isomerase
MRFLVVANNRGPVPPDMAIGLFESFSAWLKKYTANKKIEQAFGFAGEQGGGGILNVDSFDELNAIIAEWPLNPFSQIDVHPLMDLQTSIQQTKQAILAMLPKK